MDKVRIHPGRSNTIAGEIGLGRVNLEFDAAGVNPITFLIDVEAVVRQEGVLNVMHVRIQQFLHVVTAGKGGMDTIDETKRGGVVRIERVEANEVLVLEQPIKQDGVELEGVKANVGFQESKEDKLFLGGQTLEIERVGKDFLIFRNFVDGHDRRERGLERFQAGARIIEESRFQELFKHGNGVDPVIGGERHGQAELQLVLRRFEATSSRTTTRVESAATRGGAMSRIASRRALVASKRREGGRHGA